MRAVDNVSDAVHTAGGRLPSGEEYTLCGLVETSPGVWHQHPIARRVSDEHPRCAECDRLDA